MATDYVVCEALVNATKHVNASVIHLNIGARGGMLNVSIRDHGVGGADPARSSGIVGLTDRVEALSGTIAVTSPPGARTSVVVELPFGGD